MKGVSRMELYVNARWTQCYKNSYIAEAVAWSENGNHASIYTTGGSAEDADSKLMNALRELNLMPQKATKDQQ